MRRSIVLFSNLVFVASILSAETSAESARADQIFETWSKPGSPGCALSVMRDGRIIYKHGYGMADLDHDLPITPASVFHVASVSKQFTAASILLLAEDGKLSIDDPVRKYLPEVPDYGVPVTIRHLIHHVSGIRDQWSFLGLAGWRQNLDLITDDDVMNFVRQQKTLNFKPGEMYMYSNTGYTLLGQIVKRVSGKSLREFTTERIFRPLEMKNTHFRDDHAEIVKGMAYGYDRNSESGPWRASIPNFDTVGATSLLTTVEDLAKWDENFFQDWMRRGLTEKMLKRGVLNSGEVLPYAFGLSLGKYRGLATVDHGGADAGYRAALIRFPEEHFSVACLCNLGPINPSQLAYKVADIYLADRMQPVAEKAKTGSVILPVPRLQAVAGTYWSAAEAELREIKLRDGKLRYITNTGFNEDLDPLSEDRFHAVTSNIDLEIANNKLTEIRGEKRTVFVAAPRAALSKGALAEYAGVYRLQELESEWTIALEEGSLVVKRLRFPPGKIEPQIANVFTIQSRGGNGIAQFTRGKDGKIDGFVLNSGRIKKVRFNRVK